MLLNNEEWIAILERLIALTSKRATEWVAQDDGSEEAEADSRVFVLDVNNSTYRIGSVDSDGVAPFYLEILRAGEMFDQVQSSTSRPVDEETARVRNGLRDLYREIGRAVNRAPEQVASLLADLGDLEAF